jgi:propionyl-CoA carboxylase alpha chain
MLAKFIVHAQTRDEARRRLAAALVATEIHGLTTNRDLLVRVLIDPAFRDGHFDTHLLEGNRLRDLASPLASAEEVRMHCVAAALVGQHRRHAANAINSHIAAGWRNVKAVPQKVCFVTRWGEVEVAYWSEPRLEVTVDGVHLELEVPEISASHCDLVVRGVRRRFRLEEVGSQWFVDSQAGSSQLEQLSRFPATSQLGKTGSLRALTPGLVVALLVEPGQVVEEGQDLLILEAMKTEYRARAPHGGTVVELLVAVGDVVDAGSVLAVIE